MINIVVRSLVIVLAGYEATYVDDPVNQELVTSTECISASTSTHVRATNLSLPHTHALPT
jgi:hypothetical protein